MLERNYLGSVPSGSNNKNREKRRGGIVVRKHRGRWQVSGRGSVLSLGRDNLKLKVQTNTTRKEVSLSGGKKGFRKSETFKERKRESGAPEFILVSEAGRRAR